MNHRPAFPAASASRMTDAIDLLAVGVVLVSADGLVLRANSSAEAAFDLSRRLLEGQQLRDLFIQPQRIDELIADAAADRFTQHRIILAVRRTLREPMPVLVYASVVHQDGVLLVLEMSDPRQLGRAIRDERRHDAADANRRLLRNLAHEIKNPLGGIRGAAQLLEGELASPEQREFTRVIISEADRLQSLVDRVLAPNRGPQLHARINIHEVCERVRSLILAEFPQGLQILRDYDASVPDVAGDMEQLIQALLNIVRNSAQALKPRIERADACIEIRTRVARQVTFSQRHCKLALDLRVVDNGPGIPDDIRDRVFDPLVSGREGGSGLGLALVQTLIQEHDGMVDFDSEPGRTEFRLLLPLDPLPREEGR